MILEKVSILEHGSVESSMVAASAQCGQTATLRKQSSEHITALLKINIAVDYRLISAGL